MFVITLRFTSFGLGFCNSKYVVLMVLVCFVSIGCQHLAHRDNTPKSLVLVTEASHLRPLLESAFDSADLNLNLSIERTLKWYSSVSAEKLSLIGNPPITDEMINEGLIEIQRLLDTSDNGSEFADRVLNKFTFYRAAGDAQHGRVLFTAYFAPTYLASRTRSKEYCWPLYGDPSLVFDVTKMTRSELEELNLLDGHEIVWLSNELDAYLVQVNGSAQLSLVDGSVMCVAHTRTNEFPYQSIGKLLIEGGHASADEMSMQTIRRLHRSDRQLVSDLMQRNDRFVFFETIGCSEFPRSSLGITLTPEASVATDHSCFPSGGLALISTKVANIEGDQEPFDRLMINQDTGGAIKGAGRVDLYLGIGPEAGFRAGLQKSDGMLYYLVPK